jgi:hypothetical protein
LLLGAALAVQTSPAHAYVALMAGQRARPLNGTFNKVPVLHSNQPEEVTGPGILINSAPGSAYAAETGRPLRNASYEFNGEFGLHLHHKYFPPNRASISPSERRAELTLATILINPGVRPVHIRFKKGAVRNSFEAPYLANNLMGVKPLGPRPWNTGPGDATAVQMLRQRLDRRLQDEITIPARSRIVLFQTQLPALGIANALLRGTSDGPFQMAVVAAKNPTSDRDIFAVLDSRRLAPGRVYLRRIAEINRRQIFSRVGGVAEGDSYQASIRHDLNNQGPLHVPFTSTDRHHFGTRDVQVNPLLTRMVDSSLDNVGTYGVRFDIDLHLKGSGPYELVMSHPAARSGKSFTAFRGSLQIHTQQGLREVHVGLRSGQSLSLAELDLRPDGENLVRVSMVYPADATPGHLLSVVPSSQLAMLQQREGLEGGDGQQPAHPGQHQARPPEGRGHHPGSLTGEKAPAPRTVRPADWQGLPFVLPSHLRSGDRRPGWWLPPSPAVPPARIPQRSPLRPTIPPPPAPPSLIDRYRQAVEAQQQLLRDLETP